MARRLGPDQPVQNVDSTESHGLVTTKYFFSLGAGFLHKYVPSYVWKLGSRWAWYSVDLTLVEQPPLLSVC